MDNDVIHSTTQFYNYTSNLRQYRLTGLANGGVRALIVKGQDETKEGSFVHQYDAVGCWNRKEDNRMVGWTHNKPSIRGSVQDKKIS